jgi:hypothetical protein
MITLPSNALPGRAGQNNMRATWFAFGTIPTRAESAICTVPAISAGNATHPVVVHSIHRSGWPLIAALQGGAHR